MGSDWRNLAAAAAAEVSGGGGGQAQGARLRPGLSGTLTAVSLRWD